MKELKNILTEDYLNGSAEGHLDAWFEKQYKGKDEESCREMLTQHDDCLEIESVEELMKRELTDEEKEFLIQKFHDAILKNIKFGGACGWYDTCGDLN